MSLQGTIVRYGQSRLLRRASRSIPLIGTAAAVVFLAGAMRRKGVLGGAVDTALNAVPVVGAAKLLAETVRGRDFITNRRSA